MASGSTFTVYFPRTGDASDDLEDAERAVPQGGGQRVLFVDDEEPLVALATETLEELGYSPVGFTSSAAALEAFRADPKGFDAVITDERMPEMSGSALIRAVRDIRRSVPIVLLSGNVGGMVTTRAYNAGRQRGPQEAAVGARARDEPRAGAAGLTSSASGARGAGWHLRREMGAHPYRAAGRAWSSGRSVSAAIGSFRPARRGRRAAHA